MKKTRLSNGFFKKILVRIQQNNDSNKHNDFRPGGNMTSVTYAALRGNSLQLLKKLSSVP